MVNEKQKSFVFKTKAFVNKNTKQVSINIPQKKLKKSNSDIKFGEELFVTIINKKKNG